HFHIIGFVNEPQYFAQCKDFVEQHGLNNVTLMPDLPIEKRSRVLAESEFFLHSLRNEPFGITTVQAIAAGCIPVVHDSGGQKEVVPNDRLRYADEASAADVFGYLAELHAKQRQEIQQELMLHIGQYDAAVFKNKMKPLILEKLNRL
ncbi:MAG: glycosyltransferase, partial [Flavobacteriales bacterium]